MQILDWPDAWSIIKIVYMKDNDIEGAQFRLLCGWFGGFNAGDQWRINSGIVRVAFKEDTYTFEGRSGSKYHCDRTAYRTVSVMYDGIAKIERMRDVIAIEIMPDRDWQNFKFL